MSSDPSRSSRSERLVSLDAYRGFVMLVMATHGLGIEEVAQRFPADGRWQWAAYQWSHVPWLGCAFWDLIQPSFMFMVGVAAAYSTAARLGAGESTARRTVQALRRSLLLVALGVGLYSIGRPQTHFTFVNVLAQIGLGYPLVFWMSGRSTRAVLLVAGAILVVTWGAFALYPLPAAGTDLAALGLEADEPRLTGFFAHWQKHTNLAAAFDRWLLNLFPREEPFVFNGGGYQTLNFVPSLATMLAGLVVGQRLRTSQPASSKVLWLVSAGVLGLAVGWLLGQTVCPVVKRIWTPSWAIFSTGWTCLLLGGFFAVIDWAGWRRWAFPLVVVGMNSIAMYLMAETLPDFLAGTLQTHLGQALFAGTYGPIVRSASVVGLLWLVCWWLYRRGIFLRL